MAMELTAFRLYAPYFGNSIYVWGSMISVVMLALAAGYSLGGWLADRKPSDGVLYLVILGSGIYQLLIVFVVRSVLLKLWGTSDFLGPVLATLIIFVPPMTALAMTSPFVIRLLARAGHVGIAVGSVFALSTAGSVAGVVGSSFYLVPRFGTRRTLAILCGLSISMGAAGLMLRRKWAVLLLGLLGVLFLMPNPRPPASILWSGDSVYNRIVVYQDKGLRWLVLNDPHFFQTIVKTESESSGFYLDEFALGPVVVSAKKLLVLGMGAGRSIQVSQATAPDLEIDAVEIDPEVVQLAGRFFGLLLGNPKLHVHVADARPWLKKHAGKNDLVYIDLFQGGPYVPFYLTTVEFFELVRSRMNEEGVLLINIYDTSQSKELLQAMGATLSRVFPSLALLDRADGNHMVMAFPQKRALAETISRLKKHEGPGWVEELAQKSAAEIIDFEPMPGAVVFTDDWAPVEEMTRRMLLHSKK